MASIDKLKIMLSIMRELNDGNHPTASDYEIEREEFYNILEACQDEGYIKNVRITYGAQKNIIWATLDDARLTVKGMEYLHENSAVMKTYKGIKAVRDWLPW